MRETQFRICYDSRRFCYEMFKGGRPMRARKDAVERLLAAYRRYYTITRFDGVRESPDGTLPARGGVSVCGM